MKRWVSLFALVVAGCATAPRMLPPASVMTRDFVNGTDFIVAEDYRWSIGHSGQVLTVPAGFVTDYASIPQPLHSVMRQYGRHNRAAVIHDWLYWSQVCTRDQADNLMMIAMKELRVKKSRRKLIYRGVHHGGKGAWASNGRLYAEGWPKIVPTARFSLADNMTWSEARFALRGEGVRDPLFPKEPAFCALGNTRDIPA